MVILGGFMTISLVRIIWEGTAPPLAIVRGATGRAGLPLRRLPDMAGAISTRRRTRA